MSSTSTSISDLVPLVVAVLQDQAVIDKVDELQQQLNDQINERLLLQVTGPNGTPVYYQGSLNDGGTCVSDQGDGEVWIVYFGKKQDNNNNNNTIVVPLNLIDGLEIRFGGHLVLFMMDTRIQTNWYNYDEEFDRNYINSNEPQMGGIHFSDTDRKNPIHNVHGRVGPIPWSVYKDHKLDNMEWWNLRKYADDDSNPTQDLIITAIEFNKYLWGESIISLVEKMGTSTTNVHNESWMRSVRSIGRPPTPIIGEDDAAANANAADADAAANANANANADADADADTNENENNKKQKR